MLYRLLHLLVVLLLLHPAVQLHDTIYLREHMYVNFVISRGTL